MRNHVLSIYCLNYFIVVLVLVIVIVIVKSSSSSRRAKRDSSTMMGTLRDKVTGCAPPVMGLSPNGIILHYTTYSLRPTRLWTQCILKDF